MASRETANPADRLTRIHTTVLAGLALLAICSQLMIQRALQGQERYAQLISTAGRHRLLSEQLTMGALALPAANTREQLSSNLSNLRQTILLWSDSHADLQRTNSLFSLPGHNQAQVVANFARMAPHSAAMLEAARGMVATASGVPLVKLDRAALQARAAQIAQHESQFLTGMEQIILTCEREWRAWARQLKLAALGSLGAILLLLGFVGVGIFRRAARAIRQQFSDANHARALAEDIAATLARREAEAQKLALVASRTDAGVVICDANRQIEWVNDAFTALTDYTLDDVRGQTLNLLEGPEADSLTLAGMQKEVSHGRGFSDVEIQYRTRSGRGFWAAVGTQLVRNDAGAVVQHIVTLRDVTERWRAEEAWRGAEERARALIENAADVIMIVGRDGLIRYHNSSLEYALGYDTDAIIGQTLFSVVHPEDLASVRSDFEECLVHPGIAVKLRFRARHRDDSWRTVEVVATNALDKPAVAGIVLHARDATAQRQAETALRESERIAREAVTLKTRFMATLSQELRGPMNTLFGMADMLLETDLVPEQREVVRGLRRNADSLLAMINDIADLSKIEAGEITLGQRDFSLIDLVEDAAHALAPRAAVKDVELVCHLEPTVPDAVQGDPGRLRQLLLNLVTNAVKFTERGEIEIHVSCAEGSDTRALVRFAVRDTGPGIPSDRLQQLFNSFVHVDGALSRRQPGTGLGLVLARNLAELMGGEIGVDSTTGIGSTFWFTVQLARAREAGAGTAAVAGVAGTTALIVDDNAAATAALVGQLRAVGIEATATATVEVAKTALHQAHQRGRSYRLVFLDLVGTDGERLARELRVGADPSAVALIALVPSGRIPPAMETSLFAARLSKPVRRANLATCLEQVLQPASTAQPARKGTRTSG